MKNILATNKADPSEIFQLNLPLSLDSHYSKPLPVNIPSKLQEANFVDNFAFDNKGRKGNIIVVMILKIENSWLTN